MSDRKLICENMVRGYFAMWAVRQSPYGCPDDLEIQVRGLQSALHSGFREGVESLRMEWFGSYRDLEDALRRIYPYKHLKHWNTPRSAHDAPFVFVSCYDKPHPDDDFIDLDALYRNVALSCWREAERDAEFDAKVATSPRAFTEPNCKSG